MKFGALLGCHQLGSRSFFIKGYQFPVCARCAGIYLGLLLGCLYSFEEVFGFFVLLGLIPMLADGFLQLLTKYVSNNFKRFVTGVFFGIVVQNILFKLVNTVF